MRCVNCGADLPPRSRSDRRTCSPRCRVALSRRLAGQPRFVVDALRSGEGYVIVDTRWEFPMIGPYPKTKEGREQARSRAAEFECDPTRVPS